MLVILLVFACFVVDESGNDYDDDPVEHGHEHERGMGRANPDEPTFLELVGQ